MDPSQEIITQRVNPKKKPWVDVDDDTQKCRSPTRISAAVSKVLDADDLLIEILLRVGFTTTLVCATAVCRRWLHHASDLAFLRRFHELHPPRLLGFYMNTWKPRVTARFVQILPQPPELASVLRHASSILDTYQSDSVKTYIKDCRNGNVLIQSHEDGNRSTVRIHNQLCPERGMAIMPPCPRPQLQGGYTCHKILSKEEDGHVSYLYVMMHSTADRKNVAHVYMLKDGVWCIHTTIDKLPSARVELKGVFIDNKIYMPAAKRDTIVLDLMASSFAIIQLPQGVEYGHENTMLSRAGDPTGIYVVHVKDLQLSAWLGWLLVDTFCVREICASLSMLDFNASLRMQYVGDNAEFVILKMGGYKLCWNVKRKTVHRVYEMTKEDGWLCNIFPFVMIWPSTFPVLKDDFARNAM